MFHLRSKRAALGAAAALLGTLLLGVGGATAGTPAGWGLHATATPGAVTPGQDAGYVVDVSNIGPSNISQLFLVDNRSETPSYVHTDQGFCNDSGRLYCSFGALNAGDSIQVVVAYSTPLSGSSFSVTFELNTTGATFTNPQKSHGTVLAYSVSTTLTNDPDLGGAFIVDDATVTNASIGGNNHQSTLVVSPSSHIPVTVQDGSGAAGNAECPEPAKGFGECSLVNVGGGHVFDSPFKVVITVLGSSLPSGVNASQIYVLHTYIDADGIQQTETIDGTCPSEPPATADAPCIVVTKVGRANFQIDVWLLQNGGLHMGY